MLELRCLIQGEERVFPLAGTEVRIGRGTENDVVLADFSVSRQHAVLRLEESGWSVEDLKSTNGVRLNEAPVARARVREGDRLKIGGFELKLVGTGPPAADPAASAEVATASGQRTTKLPDPALERRSPEQASERRLPALPSATIVRPIADFEAAYGLETAAATRPSEKREQLQQAYSNRVFGFLTRLARLLIVAESVDQVLAQVMEIAFEALPVERGFILLTGEQGETVCELARFESRVEYRPASAVPVSTTIVDTVMERRVALVTYDALSDERLRGGDSIRIHQIRAAMCAPLWSGDRIIGVMQVDSPFKVGAFNEQDLDLLTALANYLAVAVERLRYARRVEVERVLRGRLERYHSPAVIEEVLRQSEVVGEVAVRPLRPASATVLFADLAGFTAYSESATPEAVAELLEGYFTHAVEAIFAAGGTLDKFIGDCVMAFFGAPMPQADHALRGVEAAIEIQRAMARWNRERSAQGLPVFAVRVAVNTGPVVVGEIGSNRRVDYTVLGNTVNVAARLEEYAARPGDVVLGPETRRLVGEEIASEPMGELQLKGLQQRIAAHRVLLPPDLAAGG